MVNNLYANAGDLRDPGSVPVSGKSPEGGHGNLQLGPVLLPGSVDRGTWQATVHRVAKSQT